MNKHNQNILTTINNHQMKYQINMNQLNFKL